MNKVASKQEITDLKPTKDELRVSIYINGKFRFAVENALIEKYQLALGKELSSEIIERLQEDDLKWKLLRKAEARANSRPYARADIENYLRRVLYRYKQFSQVNQTGAVEWVMNQLDENGLLNDKEFAEWFVCEKMHKKSRMQLKQLLGAKRVSSQIIENVLNEAEVDEIEQINDLVEKQIGIYRGRKTKEEIKKKVLASLMRKGYKYGSINEAIEKILT